MLFVLKKARHAELDSASVLIDSEIEQFSARFEFRMTTFCWKKASCGSAGSGGGAVAERSEAMEWKRNHGHSDRAKCKHFAEERQKSEFRR